MTMSVYDPGRDRMKSSYDRLMSQRDDENGMTPAEATRHGAGSDRKFGPLGGLVIGAVLSVPLWIGIAWAFGFPVWELLP